MKKHIVHKLYYDFEKEETWLNQMAAKGLNFIDYNFVRYLFEEGAPGEYIYRIELLPELPSHPESEAYIKFMESIGVEYMGKWLRWVYFRKKSSDGPFEIFSDVDSRIKHYRRINTLFGIIALANYIPAISNFMLGQYSLIIFNAAFAVGLSTLVIRNLKKIKKLKKQKQLYE